METLTDAQPYVLRENEGRANQIYTLLGMDKFLKVSANDTNGQFSLFFGYYARHDGAPLHVHYKEDETFYVLDGEVLFQVGDERHTLRAGDTIFLPRTIPHTYFVLSEQAKMLFMTTPGGITEAFFSELTQLKGPFEPADMQALYKKYDLGLVGPPLTK